VFDAAFQGRVRPKAEKASFAQTGLMWQRADVRSQAWSLANPQAYDYVMARGAALVTGIDDTTRDRLNSFIARTVDGPGFDTYTSAAFRSDIAAYVTQTYEGRADTIARTESALAANAGNLAAYRANDTHYVMVHDGTDYDDECAAADGQIWTVDDADANSIEHPNCGRSFDEMADEDVDPSEVDSPDSVTPDEAPGPEEAPPEPAPEEAPPAPVYEPLSLDNLANQVLNFDRMKVDDQQGIVDAVNGVNQKLFDMGIKPPSLESINVETQNVVGKGTYAYVNGGYSATAQSRMTLGNGWFGKFSGSKLETQWARDVRSGWHSDLPGLTPRQSIFVHEYGHVMDRWLDPYGGFTFLGDRVSVATRYGATKLSERWAEAFAEWASGMDTQAARDVQAVLEKEATGGIRRMALTP
jgi:hypothetical protein